MLLYVSIHIHITYVYIYIYTYVYMHMYTHTYIVHIQIPGNDLMNIHQSSHVFVEISGAALELFMLGLLDAEGLRSAAHGDLEEFGEINVVDFASNEALNFRTLRKVCQFGMEVALCF